MHTDKQLYQIFSANPEWLFELTGLASPGASRMQSASLKALDQTADCVIVPEADSQPITVAEFQFQPDEAIYTRTVIEMALVQQEFGMRAVRGLIVFRRDGHDPRTEPWNRVIDSFSLDQMLDDLERREPDHPLVAVFKPILISDDDTLGRTAVEYFRTLRDSDKLDERMRSTLLDVFVNWLEQRFRNKSKEEIETMFLGELPDLRDTRSGQDLIAIGREEGREEGLVALRATATRLASDRFGSESDDLLAKIQQMDSITGLGALIERILNADTASELL
jgi:predicted transposase YdaD